MTRGPGKNRGVSDSPVDFTQTPEAKRRDTRTYKDRGSRAEYMRTYRKRVKDAEMGSVEGGGPPSKEDL